MGYSVMFFAVDLPKLKTVWGSRDKDFLRTVLNDQAEDIDLDDEDEYEEDVPSMREAVKQIIGGKIKGGDGSEFRYGYALKVLCQQLGRMVEIDGWGVSDMRRVPFESRMMGNGPPLPIPVDSGDFPEIGHLTLAEVQAELAAMDRVQPTEDEELNEEISGFRQALQYAATAQMGLVAFRH